MIRKVQFKDKEKYIEMTRAFYSSDAVLHSIPDENMLKTFDVLMAGSPYADGYILEYNGAAAGYILLAVTYSNEAGGLVLWVEEIYILPEFQGRGFGSELLSFVEEAYGDKVARIRLEIEESNTGAMRLYNKMGFAELGYTQMYKDNKQVY